MVDIEKINSKIQEWQDKDALMRKSKEELIGIIDSLIEGGEITAISLNHSCEDMSSMFDVLGSVAEHVDPILSSLLLPFKTMAKLPVEMLVEGYMAKAVAENYTSTDPELEAYLKKYRSDGQMSDAELLANLKKIMGMDDEK